MSLHFISRTRDDPPSRIVASPLAEALHFNGGGTTSVSSAHPSSLGGTTSASSAHPSSLGGTTSASSAFPRSERVYPAIMPLAAIRPGDPSWRKASRYVRIGRDDLRVVRTATVPQSWRLRLRRPPTLMGDRLPPRRPHMPPFFHPCRCP